MPALRRSDHQAGIRFLEMPGLWLRNLAGGRRDGGTEGEGYQGSVLRRNPDGVLDKSEKAEQKQPVEAVRKEKEGCAALDAEVCAVLKKVIDTWVEKAII